MQPFLRNFSIQLIRGARYAACRRRRLFLFCLFSFMSDGGGKDMRDVIDYFVVLTFGVRVVAEFDSSIL